MYFNEIKKLAKMLVEANIPCDVFEIYDGYQVVLYADKELKKRLDDAVCHGGSHGRELGLLETYTLNDCCGYETAEQVFEGWEKMYKKAQKTC